ncbi:MAG: MFS transporter [Candidatus Taylorbacteria bacterium]
MSFRFSLRKNLNGNLFSLYLIGFFFSLHIALPAYINSTFLSGFVTERYVGLLYALSSLLTIVSFSMIPRVLSKFGNYKTATTLAVVGAISLVILATSHNPYIVEGAFIINFVIISLVSFNIDIFLEEFSPVRSTGKVRGTFLTFTNSAWVISALFASFILAAGNYSKIYLASAILALPVIGLLGSQFRKFKDPQYHTSSLLRTSAEVWKNKNVLDVFLMNFLLQFFYAWMVIYTPLYLYENVGFTWSEISLMFAIMLLAFPILDWPLGRLADTRFGEKEMLTIGFIIMAISTTLIIFIPGHNFLLWTCLLLGTRIGAAMVEVMSEIYFFKKVPDTSLNTLSFFRTMRPIAYLGSPILATIVLAFFDIKFLFIFLGILMLYGLRFSLTMKDTR